MESINIKHENFQKALHTFERTISLYEKERYHASDDMRDALVAAVIQHFEMAYETAWKYLKEALEVRHGVISLSPKSVFQDCYKEDIHFSAVVTILCYSFHQQLF